MCILQKKNNDILNFLCLNKRLITSVTYHITSRADYSYYINSNIYLIERFREVNTILTNLLP